MEKYIKKWLLRNWTVKIAALTLAIAIRYLIDLHLQSNIDAFNKTSTEQSAR